MWKLMLVLELICAGGPCYSPAENFSPTARMRSKEHCETMGRTLYHDLASQASLRIRILGYACLLEI